MGRDNDNKDLCRFYIKIVFKHILKVEKGYKKKNNGFVKQQIIKLVFGIIWYTLV